MLSGRLTTLLGLLSGTWLSTGSGALGAPRLKFRDGANGSRSLVPPERVSSALRSWKAFVGLQSQRQVPRRLQDGAAAATLPLDAGAATQETCKAVPFVQVVSRPGCTTARIRNHLCFGHCPSFYVPHSDPSALLLCNSCVPTRRRWTSVVLWCAAGGPPSPRRVVTPAVLVRDCQCRPKPKP